MKNHYLYGYLQTIVIAQFSSCLPLQREKIILISQKVILTHIVGQALNENCSLNPVISKATILDLLLS